MPTLVAYADAEPKAIAEALVQIGFSWQHPSTGEICIFSSLGDRLVVASVDAALDEFKAGALLQLWLSDSDDLAIGPADSCVRMYFDGFTASQVAQCLDALASQSIAYKVGTE
jgi:hypothetical protein